MLGLELELRVEELVQHVEAFHQIGVEAELGLAGTGGGGYRGMHGGVRRRHLADPIVDILHGVILVHRLVRGRREGGESIGVMLEAGDAGSWVGACG